MTTQDIFQTGNFFKARITRIEPTLEAAFVDFGKERHGFLPFDEIEGFDKKIHKEGAILTVSIIKEERGQKGAKLKAHMKAPVDITVHDCLSLEKGNKINAVLFYMLITCAFCLVVYLNI